MPHPQVVTAPDSWASESIKRMRERCKADLMFLSREIIGPRGVETGAFPKNHFLHPASFHIEAARIIEAEVDAIIMAPRYHLKTTLITTAGTIQFMLRNAEHRVLLVSETPTLVSKVLKEIVGNFRDNKRLRHLFPEFGVDNAEEEGTLSHFNVPCRKGAAKDFSIEAIGVGGASAGGHFDRIVTTDIVSNRTVPPEVTAETMEKTYNFVTALEGLRDATIRREDGSRKAHIIIEGTRWSPDDAYGRVLSHPGYKKFKRIVVSCWSGERDADGHRKVLWPEVFTTEEFEEQRSKSEFLFSCIFENDPKPAEDDRLFKPSWFKYYELEALSKGDYPSCPCCGGPLDVMINGDLAISEAKTADFTALPVSGICPHGSLVVLATPSGRWTPYETVAMLYDLDALWKPRGITIESVAWQKAMMYILWEEAKKPGRYPLPAWEVFPDNSPNGKVRRISMLSAYAQSRGIWVRAGDHDILVDQALRMTKRGSIGGKVDEIDALAYRAVDMMRPDSPVIEAEVVRPTLMGASAIRGEDALRMLTTRARGTGRTIS